MLYTIRNPRPTTTCDTSKKKKKKLSKKQKIAVGVSLSGVGLGVGACIAVPAIRNHLTQIFDDKCFHLCNVIHGTNDVMYSAKFLKIK